jgi:hypothetical protein
MSWTADQDNGRSVITSRHHPVPGESQTLTVTWNSADLQGATPVVSVSGGTFPRSTSWRSDARDLLEPFTS